MNGYGGLVGLVYLCSLDLVDKNNIGLEGYFMGGWIIFSVVVVYFDGYKVMVLEGFLIGLGCVFEGSLIYLCNFVLVYS